MNSEQARDRFSEALEGDLDDAERAEFEAALAGDEDLRREYDAFCATFRALGRDTEQPRVDLLPGVQRKLRQRSRGRYYRDRFAERSRPASRLLPLLMGLVMLLILGVAWLAMHLVDVREPTRPAGGSPGSGPVEAPGTPGGDDRPVDD